MVLAAGIAIADQVAKQWIVSSFQPYVPQNVVGDYFRIQFIHNTGGLFGLFQSQSPVFAVMTVVIAALLISLEFRTGWRSWVATLALGLLLGGAIGNWIDRVRLGYVVDFVDMGIGTWRFYIYNVADSAVTVGIGLLLLLTFLAPKVLALDWDDEEPAKPAKAETVPGGEQRDAAGGRAATSANDAASGAHLATRAEGAASHADVGPSAAPATPPGGADAMTRTGTDRAGGVEAGEPAP